MNATGNRTTGEAGAKTTYTKMDVVKDQGTNGGTEKTTSGGDTGEEMQEEVPAENKGPREARANQGNEDMTRSANNKGGGRRSKQIPREGERASK